MSRTPSPPFDHARPGAVAGIGLRTAHVQQVLAERPAAGWLEVHSENYFSRGGVPAHTLERVRRDYAVSLHGVGLSLGSADGLDAAHLLRLREAIARYEPFLVSDHLCWCSVDGSFLNDLLPLPYTAESLALVARHVEQAQEYLGRQILVENPSSYFEYRCSDIPEWEFLRELACRTGCGVLLDVNNVYVSACNHGFDARRYIDAISGKSIREIHLAGHTRARVGDGELLIDTHDQRVCDAVWDLYAYTVRRIGGRPTLIEWDSELPPLGVLLEEMRTADYLMEQSDVRIA